VTRFRRLKMEAHEAATWRGHSLSLFKTERAGRQAYATCGNCPALVAVNTHPMPNGIDVGGAAVALTCPV